MRDEAAAWLARAKADAAERGLPQLEPLLETLSRALRALREADADFGHPASAHEADAETSQRTR
jgi:hypothetical protein